MVTDETLKKLEEYRKEKQNYLDIINLNYDKAFKVYTLQYLYELYDCNFPLHDEVKSIPVIGYFDRYEELTDEEGCMSYQFTGDTPQIGCRIITHTLRVHPYNTSNNEVYMEYGHYYTYNNSKRTNYYRLLTYTDNGEVVESFKPPIRIF